MRGFKGFLQPVGPGEGDGSISNPYHCLLCLKEGLDVEDVLSPFSPSSRGNLEPEVEAIQIQGNKERNLLGPSPQLATPAFILFFWRESGMSVLTMV